MQRLLVQPSRLDKQDKEYDTIDAQTPQVLVAGMGRFGQIVARLLTAQRIPFVALEHNAETVEDLRRFGNQLYYGDPTRPELLRAAGADRIKVFVMAMDDPDTNIKAVRLIRRLYPQAKVLARARNRQHAWKLMDLGAEPFREVLGSSLELSERMLVELGAAQATAQHAVSRFRHHDEDLLRRQYLVYDDEAAVIQTSREARADLMQLFEADVETGVPETVASAAKAEPPASDPPRR